MRPTTTNIPTRRAILRLLAAVIGVAVSAMGIGHALAADGRHEAEERLERQPVKESTWVDHDGQPVPQPHVSDPSHAGHLVRESFVEPISHLFDIPDKIIWLMRPLGVRRVPDAPNVNAYDEVANSSWFTNRNHVRALSTDAIREGPFGPVRPTPPYTIKSVKTHGFNPGFNMKDAAGKRWVVKLDRVGFPQISSGAGVVSSRLVWAAGYNISHDEAFTFHRGELSIDPDLASGKDGKKPFRDADLEALLKRGARTEDGRYYASASFFLPGTPIGPFSFRGIRQDDPNDRFRHKERRDLRGLFVVYSWVNNWDVKDDQSLDTFGPDSANGHVTHYLLDVNGSLGAAAEGPKPLKYGYEQRFDTGRVLQRFVTLGFSTDPWRRARQDSGIPSVGNFEAVEFDPADWAPLQYMEPFRRMTLADAYWGAKIVASFSNAQIAAAVDAAGYEDPRAREYIQRTLIARRDKIARFWFARVAPLDFFHVKNGYLVFHDLAVDLGLTPERGYEVEERGGGGSVPVEVLARDPRISLGRLGRGTDEISLKLEVAGSRARPVRVDLRRSGHDWVVTRVRHG